MSNEAGLDRVLILAGGRGERFWPWSTPKRPKQLLPLASRGRTLLRAAFERALALVSDRRHIIVMTSSELRDACQGECPGAVVFGEPMMRNTAPAIAAAASTFSDDAVFASLHADHAIEDEAAFIADLARARDVAASQSVLVTLGISPTGPATSFGYIHRGERLQDRLYRVARFKEKPDGETAKHWLETGEYSWNSGMFVWRKRTFFDALAVRHPDIAALRDFGWGGGPSAFAAALRPRFEPLPSISVDHAVLEGAPNVVVLEASFDWDDVGSWTSWAHRQPHDDDGNVRFGRAYPVECRRCIVVGDGVPAAPLGLEDMIVVATLDGTLACPVELSEQVRKSSEAVRQGLEP